MYGGGKRQEGNSSLRREIVSGRLEAARQRVLVVVCGAEVGVAAGTNGGGNGDRAKVRP